MVLPHLDDLDLDLILWKRKKLVGTTPYTSSGAVLYVTTMTTLTKTRLWDQILSNTSLNMGILFEIEHNIVSNVVRKLNIKRYFKQVAIT